MKNKKVLTTVVTAFTAAGMLLTGCAAQTAEETPETEQTEEETKETKETTKKTEETTSDAEETSESDEESFYCAEWPSLADCEGFEDYTVAIDWDNVNLDTFPDDWELHDLSTIQDDELRTIAQSYADQGFTIDDPALDLEYGFGYGDGDYMFNQGFNGYKETDKLYEGIAVYRMNEAIFEGYLTSYVEEFNQRSDDGTIIRVGADDCYVEFNRDTGIGTYYMSYDTTNAVG